jgi:hypothetical protein
METIVPTSSIDRLRDYVRGIRRRRARLLSLREISLGIAGLAVLFTAFGILEMVFQLPVAGRIALAAALVVAAGVFVWRCVHLHREMTREERRVAHFVDEHMPELEQRLITSIEFGEKRPTGDASALAERLWQDTQARLKGLDLSRVSSIRTAWPAVSAAILVLCGLFFAFNHYHEFSLAGRRIIMPWTQPHEFQAPPLQLTVEPGTVRIQRGSDVMLIARVANAEPVRVDLYLQTDSVNWSRFPMTRDGEKNSYVYFLAALENDLNYYIDIGVKRSDRHRITVFDLPRVEQIDVDYVYPEYTGMKNRTVEDGGDVIAPEGTRITLHAAFNKAVDKAAVHFSDGTSLDLSTAGSERKSASGSFIVTKDLTYTIKVIDAEQINNEDPYEYFVQSIPDAPPVVTLIRPGRDRRVMSLEEVSIAAAAEDDYGLADFALNYTVAGGENQKIDFLVPENRQLPASLRGETTLYLENLGVSPGDFVFYHITARDNNRLKGASEIVSDIYFLEVAPTDEMFRRASQPAGGGGGSGGGRRSSSALVENQKNIIAATWKLLRQRQNISPEEFENDMATITESQRQVMQRAQLSLQRLSERLSFSDQSYQRAVEHLNQAVSQMKTAVEKLTSRQPAEALGPEQSALREIMKAEAESRNTTVQMANNRGGGGGGGGSNRERQDLMELFEMELGRLENRYEMPRQTAGTPRGIEQDDTLEKLRDLARRQERLNRGQQDLTRRQDLMDEEQRRRRLEELRREQEELMREAQDLSRQMSRLARQDGFRQWSDHQRRLEEAARRMQETGRSLGRQDTDRALTGSRQVLENLRNQEKEMRLDRQAAVAGQIDSLKRKAQALQMQEQQILKTLQAIENQGVDEASPADDRILREIENVISGKEKMQKELSEAGEMLRSIAEKGRAAQPEIADRAVETLRALETEGIKRRIAESRRMLEEGWLSLSMDAEEKIEQSVERISQRMRNLDRPSAPSRDEQIRQAAADARGLRRELESLQKEIEALKRSNGGQRARLSGSESRPDGALSQAPGQGDGQERIQQRLERSRRYARGLVQPWARGERWGVDARSIQRELSEKEISDFISQPDLWRKLLQPVRELESTLQAEAQGRQLKKNVFSTPEESVPTRYRDLVDEYFRELSRVDRENSR